MNTLHKHLLKVRLLKYGIIKQILHPLLPLPSLLYLCLGIVIVAKVAFHCWWLRLFLLGCQHLMAWLPPRNSQWLDTDSIRLPTRIQTVQSVRQVQMRLIRINNLLVQEGNLRLQVLRIVDHLNQPLFEQLTFIRKEYASLQKLFPLLLQLLLLLYHLLLQFFLIGVIPQLIQLILRLKHLLLVLFQQLLLLPMEHAGESLIQIPYHILDLLVLVPVVCFIPTGSAGLFLHKF